MPDRYESLRTEDGQAWIKSSSVAGLRDVDAVVFDCDGVLIDTSKSYDATTTRVADRLIQLLFGTKLPWTNFVQPLILRLRRTGLFNNDWDTTYALIMFAGFTLWEAGDSLRTEEVTARIRSIIEQFTASLKDNGSACKAVNRYLRHAGGGSFQDFSTLKLQEKLGYPGAPPRSFMATVFDETYHGPSLYRQMYGTSARYYGGEGLIEGERILIRRIDLAALNRLLGKGKLAMATGRPFLAAKHVLKSTLAYFNREASFFLGDADVHPELAAQLSSFRKPSGHGLIHASEFLPSNVLLCVGDSTEDIMMVENARTEISAYSAGVYGTSIDGAEQMRFFRNRKVDLILPGARSLPTILKVLKR